MITSVISSIACKRNKALFVSSTLAQKIKEFVEPFRDEIGKEEQSKRHRRGLSLSSVRCSHIDSFKYIYFALVGNVQSTRILTNHPGEIHDGREA